MDVRRSIGALASVMAAALIASLPVQAQDQPAERVQILAGPIGKSSSASARVTLVIPPRPEAKKAETKVTVEKEAEKKNIRE